MHYTHSKTGAVSRRALTAFFMLLVLAGGLFLSAEAALAADKPKWVEVKLVSLAIGKNPQVKKLDEPGYLCLEVKIKHTNNSSNKTITALYDKTGMFTLECYDGVFAELKSTKVNRVTLDPKQSITLSYSIPITRKTARPERWWQVNDDIQKRFKKITVKYVYDLKVKSQGI